MSPLLEAPPAGRGLSEGVSLPMIDSCVGCYGRNESMNREDTVQRRIFVQKFFHQVFFILYTNLTLEEPPFAFKRSGGLKY